MSDLWLKIKAWTKGVVAGAVLLYMTLFLIFNSGQEVTFWYWFKHEPKKNLLLVEFVAFTAGVLLTLMTMTLLRTIRQIRQTRSANRTDRLEREVAEMKMKSSMLQTKPADSAGVTVKVDSLGGVP